MSWSVSGTIEAATEGLIWDLNFIPQQGNGADESVAQYEAACVAVGAILEAGVIGAPPYALSMGGHANDGHGDVAGWSNDMVTINLSRRAEVKA